MALVAATELDPGLCPLCQNTNRCAIEVEKASGEMQPPCWCTPLTFDAELLARVPPQSRNLACICQRCARF